MNWLKGEELSRNAFCLHRSIAVAPIVAWSVPNQLCMYCVQKQVDNALHTRLMLRELWRPLNYQIPLREVLQGGWP